MIWQSSNPLAIWKTQPLRTSRGDRQHEPTVLQEQHLTGGIGKYAEARTCDLGNSTDVDYLARYRYSRHEARSIGGESTHSPFENNPRQPAHSWCRIQVVRTAVAPSVRHAAFSNAVTLVTDRRQ